MRPVSSTSSFLVCINFFFLLLISSSSLCSFHFISFRESLGARECRTLCLIFVLLLTRRFERVSSRDRETWENKRNFLGAQRRAGSFPICKGICKGVLTNMCFSYCIFTGLYLFVYLFFSSSCATIHDI